jgi:alkyl hydroperoxide reductase subunit AhpC
MSCVREMPSVQRAHEELKKDGIQVITVSIDGTGEAAVKPIFAKGGYTIPALLDTSMEVARGFGVRGVPSTVVVDNRGMIRARTLGHIDYGGAELRNFARELARGK